MPTMVNGRDGEVVFGPGLPTIIIGERINPTGRKKVATQLACGNFEFVEEEAKKQKLSGAQVLDVNVGAAGVDEICLLPQAVKRVTEATGLPICIDSSNPEAIKAAIEVYPYKPIVNSVTGEEKSLDVLLPLVKQYNAAVICIPTDENGIPEFPENRVDIVKRIVNRAESIGILREDLIVDCLVLSSATDPKSALVTLETLEIITHELSLSTTLGVSNISFGMPERSLINASFLAMAIKAGLSSAIIDPTDERMVFTLVASNFLTGKDENAQQFLSYYRLTRKN